MLSGLLNVIGLGTCFLGGVFVPQEILPDEVLKVAHYIPTYWYIKMNDLIKNMGKANNEFFSVFGKGIGIQLLFAATILVITIVIVRTKNNKKMA